MLRKVILAHTGMGTRAHTPRMRAHTKTTESRPKILIKIERNAAAEKIQMPSLKKMICLSTKRIGK